MLPALDRLSLSRTGEFYALSQPELDQFAAEDKLDPITLDPFKRDADGWRTFRVRNATPRADGEYKYHYYKASALWQHYDSDTPKKDPLTNQPIWYEDWMALHDEYDPFPNAVELIPGWVYDLPTREPGTVKAQRPPPPPPRVFAPPSWVTPGELRVRRMEALEETPPSSPTPIWVHRQPNRPQHQLSDEERESERLYAVRNRARERFDRLLRADDANTTNALEQAMNEVNQAGVTIQEFLDRRATDENDPNGLRTLQARSEERGRQEMAERMQRQVAEARERWSERMETFASDLDLVNELNRRRQDWTRLTTSANPTLERLNALNRRIYRLEGRLIEVFNNRLQNMTREDSRSEATQAATEQALEEIGEQRLRRTTTMARWERREVEEIVNEPFDLVALMDEYDPRE